MLKRLIRNQRGDIKTSIMAIVGGVITVVMGLVLESTVLTQAATSGVTTGIG